MRRWITAASMLASLVALDGCLPQNGLNDSYLRLYAQSDPRPENFYECHGFHCARQDHIELAAAEWQGVRAVFSRPAADAQQERQQVAQALAQLQRLAGQRTGTAVHQWTRHGGPIDGNPAGDLTQLDCIDESVNSWTYLTMLARDRLLKFHRVGPLSAAGSVLGFDYRNAAVLIANGDGGLFAVDATLVDETEPPPIFPLALWRAQWPPVVPATDRNEPQHGA